MREPLRLGPQVACGSAPALQNPQAMSPTRDADDVADDFESRLRPLWLRAQAGDEAAYRAALQRIAVRLRAYLRRRMQAWPDEVEDLVQETLLALHLQRGTWDASLPVGAWMFAIARHKLVDLWRRHGRRAAELASLDALDEHETPAAGDHEQHLARRDLGVLLGSISSAQREAIVLTKIEGLSLAEVSARTGASVAAVKVQVHRGLKKLAELAWKTT
jgi:RNA polymerase sigma-70 factor (ECF subfamily)